MRFDNKSTKQRAKSFKLTELSGVTSPAHKDAMVTFFKAADIAYAYTPADGEPKLRIDDVAHVGAAIAALGPKGFRGNKVQIPEADLPGVIARVRAAWRKFHPDMTDEDMPQVIRKFSDMFKSTFDDAINEKLSECTVDLQMRPVWDTIWMHESALREAVEEAAKNGEPVKPVITDFVMRLSQSLLNQEDNAMSAELQKQIDDLKAEVVSLTAKAAMNDAQKAYYNTLDETAKSSFLVMDTVTRDVMVKTAKAADETIKIDGVEIFKSAVGDSTFAVMKRQQDQINQQTESAAVAKFETLAKSSDFDALPGEVTLKGAALRAVDSLPDAVKVVVNSMLKAGAEAMKARHTPAASRVDLEGMSAQDKLDATAKALAAKEGISFEAATVKVMETPEGAELYKMIDEGK